MKMLQLPAVFTVEAALLMPLILGVLIAVLIAGFYLHDRACMQGAACEAAAMGSNLAVYDDRAAAVRKLGKQLLHSRLMWSRRVKGTASASSTGASAEFSGDFAVPGIAGQLWSRKNGKVKRRWSRTIYEPAKVIRRIRGARYLIETARGKEPAE